MDVMFGLFPRARSGRARPWSIGVAVASAAVLVATLLPTPPVGADDPADAVAPAMERLTASVDRVVAAEAVSATALAGRQDAAELEARTAAERNRTSAAHDDQRARYGQLGAASYVRHGVASARDHQVMVAALTARKALLAEAAEAAEAAEEAHRSAAAALVAAERAADAAETERVAAEAQRGADEVAADQTLAAVGATDLPAVAYLAYKRAAETANSTDPGCRLSGAVLAGLGRVAWRHGRPTGPTAELGFVEPGPGEPRGPYDLERASAPVAERLCAGDSALDSFAPLQRAVWEIEQDSARVRIILAAARRYSRIPGVDLGAVPDDPYQAADGVPQFDDGSPPLFPGDVAGMIDWAMSRLGTPYSQCLGPEARPQDPICPPGTNRYGAGFFDCSGFVWSAYRKIGIAVPATTYAMEADPAFMALKVADRLDPRLLLPGDVFLMDGHTGMYVGGGMIIHASGGGLGMEPIPSWVAHATFAVLRPTIPFGAPGPLPG
jgi:hypothetical protein